MLFKGFEKAITFDSNLSLVESGSMKASWHSPSLSSSLPQKKVALLSESHCSLTWYRTLHLWEPSVGQTTDRPAIMLETAVLSQIILNSYSPRQVLFIYSIWREDL